jgi:hypothetical protein
MSLGMSLAPQVPMKSTENLRIFEEMKMAGRQGVSAVAFRNSNKHEPFQRNWHEVSDLTFSDSFVGFRLFTVVFRFFQRNDTRNVARRENPPGLSRRNTYA